MSTSLAYHTQGIVGFQHQAYDFSGGVVTQRLVRNEWRCPCCHRSGVRLYKLRTRQIQGAPCGTKKIILEVDIHRIYCPHCGEYSIEKLPFLSHPMARITKNLERTLVELRHKMSITDISNYYKIPWRTIQKCEKDHLKKKCRRIRLKDVRHIGIDEICVGHDHGKPRYLTIVRNLDSGAVIFVGDGRSGDSLMDFLKKIHYSKAKIKLVAMDMSKAYVKWVKDYLPNASIVFDHFHVIKLMNEKIDKIRRNVLEKLDNEQKAMLKNQRFTLLRNYENLKPEAQEHLVNIQATFKELGEAYMMKEALRSIYKTAQDSSQAETALMTWCETARLLDSKPLKTMANTIQTHLDGILGYWIFGVSSAAMEGFNNKIRHLISQAYGYHDEEYFKLKIFDLPNIRIQEI